MLYDLGFIAVPKSTSFMQGLYDEMKRAVGIPKVALCGLAIRLVALAYPKVLYWGFHNRPFTVEKTRRINALTSALSSVVNGGRWWRGRSVTAYGLGRRGGAQFLSNFL